MSSKVPLRRASGLLLVVFASTGVIFLVFHHVSIKYEYITDTLASELRAEEQLNDTPPLATHPTTGATTHVETHPKTKSWRVIQESKPTPKEMETLTQQKLIIMTYMRSGSSFTGALFGAHPEVFYVFEPLWYLKYANDTKKILRSYLKKTISNITESQEAYRNQGVEIMGHFLNCELESLDEGSLTQPHLLRSPTTYNYSICLKMTWGQNDTYQTEMIERIPGCIKNVQDTCRPAKATVLKVIEAKMTQAEALMRSDPKVKVLHLIRDPRGVLSSRRYFGKFDDNDPDGYSSDICRAVLEDIIVSRGLSQTFQGRILTVRYEDIVKDPIRVTKQLYRFVGLDMTPPLEKKVWEMTYAGLPDDCNICPVRSNSTETANGWRKTIGFQTVAKIQEKCRTLFEVMGYRNFMTEDELRDIHIPTTFSDYDSRLFKVDIKE